MRSIILIGIVIAGFALRFLGFSEQPFDSHSTRQCQTLATIEDFHRNGINLMKPNTIYMGYPGTLVLELPLFQALAASVYHAMGDHIELVRLLNIAFGACTAWLLFGIVRFAIDRTTAVTTVCIYWLAPLNIVYQRSTLIDPMAVCCGLAALYGLMLIANAENVVTRRWPWFLFAVGVF